MPSVERLGGARPSFELNFDFRKFVVNPHVVAYRPQTSYASVARGELERVAAETGVSADDLVQRSAELNPHFFSLQGPDDDEDDGEDELLG